MYQSPLATAPVHQAATPLKIIVVDDAAHLREHTVQAIARMGHHARGIAAKEVSEAAFHDFAPDFLILDLGASEGLRVAKYLREAYPDLGIIMLAAQVRVDDKVAAYESGVDFYLAKPIAWQELGAAIDAGARRLQRPQRPQSSLTLAPGRLQLCGTLGEVDLSKRECSLLRAFLSADEQLMDVAQIQSAVGKSADEFIKSTLEVQIVRLRKKLEAVGAIPPTIKAVRGVGYQLCVPISLLTLTATTQRQQHV